MPSPRLVWLVLCYPGSVTTSQTGHNLSFFREPHLHPLVSSLVIPQGSILGPLLFILAFDGIFHLPLTDASFLMDFADDVTYSRGVHSDADVVSFFEDLKKIYNWIEEHAWVQVEPGQGESNDCIQKEKPTETNHQVA